MRLFCLQRLDFIQNEFTSNLIRLQTWFGLSDYEVEERVNDSIAFSKFVGLELNSTVPDHRVLNRFRTALTKNNSYDKVMKEINQQLERHKIIIKTGTIIDASIIDTPLKPKGKPNYEVPKEREATLEQEPSKDLIKQVSSGTDLDGRYSKTNRQIAVWI